MTADDLPAAFASMPPAWRSRLEGWSSAAEIRIVAAVKSVSAARAIAPADPFRALRLVSPEQSRVVVFGQDPYPTAGQADGLAFSAPRSTRPSLRRIFDVLEADRPGWKRPVGGRLDAWAAQGVLLLNPTLSVEIGRPNSHTACGWQVLTSLVVRVLLKANVRPVFLLWGNQAAAFYDDAASGSPGGRVLRTRHPSNDFKRRFMAEGSHFAATADVIDWWVLHD